MSARTPTLVFDSPKVELLIAEWKESGDPKVLGEIIILARPLVTSLIYSKNMTRFADENELLSLIDQKMLKQLASFDPERGTAFTLISLFVKNTICNVAGQVELHWSRTAELNDFLIETIPDQHFNGSSAQVIDDLEFKMFRLRTTLTDPHELEAQRWLVRSFVDAGFRLRRFQAANTCMQVFGLGHDRARALHDLTLLEIRRTLYDERRPKLITPESLFGKKDVALCRYAKFLTPEQFSKLAVLMHSLTTSLIESGNNVEANLKLILEGNPAASLLFDR